MADDKVNGRCFVFGNHYPFALVDLNLDIPEGTAQTENDATGGTETGQTDAQTGIGSAGETRHTHNYAWKTVKSPTVGEDGLEVYACTICGYYELSVPISAYSYTCSNMAKEILTAKQNTTITLDSGRWKLRFRQVLWWIPAVNGMDR